LKQETTWLEYLPLMFNDFGIIVGLTHVLMPFAVISILSSLFAIESNLEEASNALGACGGRCARRRSAFG